MNETSHLVLADGRAFRGKALGKSGVVTGEVCFTTGMSGYQEVLTDPSYHGQIVVMTSPEMGNTGTNADDDEAQLPELAGFVIRKGSPRPSSWRSESDLDSYLRERGVVAIEGVETRALTRHVRDHGAQMAALGTEDVATLHDRAKAATPMEGRDLAREVTTDASYTFEEGLGVWDPADQAGMPGNAADKPHVVAVDYGVKRSILRCLVASGARVTVVPAQTSAADLLALAPDGVFLSNGPGDPAAVDYGVRTVQELLGKRPLFGICLGQQILALALGGKTYKLKFGHRGLNQPVQDLATGRVEVTTQNHGFAVDVPSLLGRCTMSHVHLNDGTCEGIEHTDSGAFGVQYHPEASAGPHDSRHLFARFIERIEDRQR